MQVDVCKAIVLAAYPGARLAYGLWPDCHRRYIEHFHYPGTASTTLSRANSEDEAWEIAAEIVLRGPNNWQKGLEYPRALPPDVLAMISQSE
jgi:hypothetical protein